MKSDFKVRKLYNNQAHKWSSDEPRVISDLICRSAVVEFCNEMDLKDKVVLDLGCGEGYVGRQVSRMALKLIGIDLSEEMIRLANSKKGLNETYYVSDMRTLNIESDSIDLVLAVMSVHYLEKFTDLVLTFEGVARVLKRSGEFIFAIPHPLGALINHESNYYIHEKFDFNYAQDEGKYFNYKMKSLVGKEPLDIGFYFHSISSYSRALNKSGFVITEIFEPSPSKDVIEKYGADVEERIPSFLIMRTILKS